MKKALHRTRRKLTRPSLAALATLLAATPSLALPDGKQLLESNTYRYAMEVDAPCGKFGELERDNRLTPEDLQRAEAALAAEERESGPDSEATRTCALNLAFLYRASVAWRGQYAVEWPGYDKAEALFIRAWESAMRVFGSNHPASWAYGNYLATFYVTIGSRVPEVHDRALEVIDAIIPKRDFQIAKDPRLVTLQIYATEFGDVEEQAAIAQRFVEFYAADRSFPRSRLNEALLYQARALGQLGRTAEEVAVWRKIVALQTSVPELREERSYSLGALAEAYRRAGLSKEADIAEREMNKLVEAAESRTNRVARPPMSVVSIVPPPPPPPVASLPPTAPRPISAELMQKIKRSADENDMFNAAAASLSKGLYKQAIEQGNVYRAMRSETMKPGEYDRYVVASVSLSASALMELGRIDEAVALLETKLGELRAAGFEDLPDGQVIQLLIPTGEVKRGRMAVAEKAFADLVRRRSVSEEVHRFATIRLAGIYIADLRLDEAERLLSQVSGDVKDKGFAGGAVELAMNQAQLQLLRGRPAAAIAILDGAEADMRREFPEGHPKQQEVRLASAMAQLAVNPARAERGLRMMLGESEASPDRSISSTVTARLLLASALKAQRKYDDAIPHFRKVISEVSGIVGDDDPATLITVAEWMEALVNAGVASEADVSLVRRSADALRKSRRGGTTLARPAGASTADDERRFFATFADLLWEGGGQARTMSLRDAFLALQDSAEGDADRIFRQRVGRLAAAKLGPELSRIVERRDALIGEGNARLASALPGMALQSLVADAQRAARLRDLNGLTDQIRGRFPDYFSLIAGEAVDVSTVRKLLDADEALLLIVPAPRGTHVVAVTSDGERWLRADIKEAEVKTIARRLISDASLTTSDPAEFDTFEQRQQPGRPAFDRTAAHRLYVELIRPFEDQLKGRNRLIVSAAGPLAGLPFAALVTRPPQGEDNDAEDLRTTSWLANTYAISQLPSVQSLVLLRRNQPAGGAPAARDMRAVAIGNPILSVAPPEQGARGARKLRLGKIAIASAPSVQAGQLADSAMLARLYELPGTEVEMSALRRVVGSANARLFARDKATERTVRSTDLSKASLLLFATHGMVPDEIMDDGRTVSQVFRISEPGLVLTPPDVPSAEDDGFVSASEVATLKLDADWVILSACNTATTRDANAQGISALSRAFFYAGAHSLLASYWPVADKVAPIITSRAIELNLAGDTRAEALRKAAAEVRDGGVDGRLPREWSHPFYWTPLILIGESR